MRMRGMGVAEIETSPFWGHSSPSGLDEDRHTAFRVVVRPWSCVFCSRFYFVALNLTMFSGVQVSTGCGLWWFRVSFIRIPSAIQMFEAGGPWRGSAGTPGVFTRYNGMQLVTGMYICTQYVSTSKYRCAIDVRSIWHILSKNALFQQESKAMIHVMPRCPKDLKKNMISWEPKGSPQCNRRNKALLRDYQPP